jgi:hypothetical protein
MLIRRYGKDKGMCATCRFPDGSVFLYPLDIYPKGIKHKDKRPILVILPYEGIHLLSYWRYVVNCVIGKIKVL